MRQGSMDEMKPIRVLIVDDHAVVRGGLSDFLLAYDDLELCGEASSGEAALLLCEREEPDVVLMDLVMEGMDGAEATAAIRSSQPSIQVIALTSFREDDLVQKAIQAGAIGYLLKNVSAEELAEAIRDAYRGRPTLAPEAAQALMDAATQKESPIEVLTPRQTEVLELMVKGMRNPEIAECLTVSEATVKHHVRAILEKLGASNRSEAVAIAIRQNIIQVDE
jgi:NarL family two-component system response regulator LiaR